MTSAHPAVLGLVLLDKPLGISSNRALQRVKRLYGAAKAGHVGSLDPLATGMLPICLGEATKIAGDVLSGRKCYRFLVRLGARTATGDAEGDVVEHAAVPVLDPALVERALAGLRGAQSQVPPMYSALKRDGQPLYRLARAGIEVERASRDIQIHSLEVLSIGADALELRVVCSKGTYVRTLGEDVARALGTCGHLGALRREWVEPFADAAMVTLAELEDAAAEGRALPAPLAPDVALPDLPQARLSADETARVLHGQAARVPGFAAARRVCLYGPAGEFLGLGECQTPGVVQPRRLFVLADLCL